MPTLGDILKETAVRHKAAALKNDLDTVQELQLQYEALLNSWPNEPSLLCALGTCKLQLGMNGSAVVYFERALQDYPNKGEIWGNLGVAWQAERFKDKAWECYQKELELLPTSAHAYSNMANFFVNSGNPEGGLEYAQKALELEPDNARTHWNYSLMLLEMGRWSEGLQEYEWGLKSLDRPDRPYGEAKWWNGEPGRVVVYGEQGMGDEIMWASCLPDLMAEATDVVFDCHPRLQTLFERSFGVECYGGRKDNPTDLRAEWRISLGSLFHRYRRTGGFPRTPYLRADPERVERYRKRLADLGPGPYVGLAWKAGGKKTNTIERSFKLSRFEPIVRQGGTFVSLQYLYEDGKCERFKEKTGLTIHHWPEVVEPGEGEGARSIGYNYDETAALVEALDLVIAPNTTVVHLCGALGKECWTLTPDACAWRYGLRDVAMPMYESVIQIRELGDWDIAFQGLQSLYAQRLKCGL